MMENKTEKDIREEIAVADAGAALGADMDAADVNAGYAPAPAQALPRQAWQSYERKGVGHALYKFCKRTFDIVSATLMLIVLSPLILLCLFIKWAEDFRHPRYELHIERADDSMPAGKGVTRIIRKDGVAFDCSLTPVKKEKGGKRFVNPVYTSTRVGKNRKEFKLFKIRSMVPNAEEMKAQLIEAGLNEADPPVFKMKDDPRITKFGKFLRKTSCDELPQLLNIIRGDMSVVGPRPALPDEVKEYTVGQLHRFDVKGGLLCLWQIQKNRNDIPFEEWVRLDLDYIARQSAGLDLKIIFKGAYMVLFDRSGE